MICVTRVMMGPPPDLVQLKWTCRISLLTGNSKLQFSSAQRQHNIAKAEGHINRPIVPKTQKQGVGNQFVGHTPQ